MHANVPSGLMAQLAHARSILERHLGDGLVAIHLFGSALLGGLKPSSDIDLLVTVSQPPDDETRNALMADLLSASAPPASDDAMRPLEVTVLALGCVRPWRHPARREMQFGEWLRADIQAGRFEAPTVDHDLAILLRKVGLHGVSLRGPEPFDVFDPIPDGDIARALQETIAQWNAPEDWEGEERNIVLALARIWYTAVTGRIASKDEAADWLLSQLPAPHRIVLEKARAAYRGEADDDLAQHPDEVSAFIGHARSAIARILEETSTVDADAARRQQRGDA